MQEMFVILCCENIRPEVDAILAAGDMPGAAARSFPFHCGHVRSVWETVRDQYYELEAAGAKICLCGCGCANSFDIPREVLARPALALADAGAPLFLPESMVEYHRQRGDYLILPGRLMRWKENAGCNGLNQTVAREMYNESATGIVLLDTGVQTGIGTALAGFAEFTGLPARKIPVGTGHFHLRLRQQYLEWELKDELPACRTAVRLAEKRVADYTMVADLTGRILGTHDELTIIRQTLELVTLLCSPRRAGFLSMQTDNPPVIISSPPDAYSSAVHFQRIFERTHPYIVSESGDGFLFPVVYHNDILGVLSVDQVSLPESLNEYINLTHFISQIAGLSITIARTHQALVQTVKERDSEIEERRRIEDALKDALKKLNMLSSITRHDILNQITGLRTFLELSREDLKGTKFEAFIEKEEQAAEAIQRQIEFTKYYQDIGVNEAKWQDAGVVIREAAGQLRPEGIDLQVAVENVEVFADPLIVKVFFNLMENSLRHGGRVTCMSFSSRISDDGLVITYCDNGTGISAEDKTKLFRKGFGKHTGLGLFLSREILAITGITITENGEPGKGVRFEIRVLPGSWRHTGEA
jgi:signal transduction histidine kinase